MDRQHCAWVEPAPRDGGRHPASCWGRHLEYGGDVVALELDGKDGGSLRYWPAGMCAPGVD